MEPAVIVGCGDIGCRVARRLVRAGRTVTGVVRSSAGAERVAGAGGKPIRLDLDRSLPADAVLTATGTVLFYFAPPPREGTDDPRLARVLAACDEHGLPQRVVYISTSGVYGDCGGAWVDETRPLAPCSDRARRRVAAESHLTAWSACTGVEAVILRVPGIYGPGRLPVERLRQGLPVIRPEDSGYSNRIHAEDLVTAALAAAERGHPGQAYNIADGHPTSMCDYFDRVADLLGLPRPPRINRAVADTRLSASMLSFAGESKRLITRRMREELGVEPRYPDLVSGLASCLPS